MRGIEDFARLAAWSTTLAATAAVFLQLFLKRYANPRELRSFPTRRSSDLAYDEANGNTGPIRVGAGLEACVSSNLRVKAHILSTGTVKNGTTATTVTITSSNSGVAAVSPYDTTTVGSGSTVVTIPAGTFYA